MFFWIFYAIVLFGYSFLYKKSIARSSFLFFVSLFFYYKTGGYFFSLLIFSTLVDYFIGRGIHLSKKDYKRKLLVVLSVFVNLGVLAYFKYSYFIIENINDLFGTNLHVVNYLSVWTNAVSGSNFSVSNIILPVGISFYTFQTISYSIDVYRKKVDPVKSIIDFGFYVSFFPQLVAGPIVRAAEFIPQIYQKYSLTKAEFSHAIFLIMNGLFKKMIVSDYISINFVERVFDAPLQYSGLENLLGLYGYSIQIYCDFSGYTDIAIGIALLLGFRLPLNFNSPYKAANITDFWRRWHISLSSWLRDYLYIPLGGNKKTSVFVYLTIIVSLGFIILLNEQSFWNIAFLGVGLLFWIISLAIKDYKIFVYMVWICLAGLTLTTVMPEFPKINNIEIRNWGGFIYSSAILVFWVLSEFSAGIRSLVRTMINLLLTMLLGGLWHGANVKFIIWGAIHGLALAIDKIRILIFGNALKKRRIEHFIAVFLTFHIVVFAWLFFRAKDEETIRLMLDQMFYHFGFDISLRLKAFYMTSIIFISFSFIAYRIYEAIKGEYGKRGREAGLLALIIRDIVNLPIFNLAVLFIWHVVYFGLQFILSFFGYTLSDSIGLAIMPEMLEAYRIVFAIIAGAFLIHLLPINFKEKYRGWFIKTPVWLKAVIVIIGVYIIYQAKSSDLQAFIYFQF
ncbi:MAG: MBOAT family protein [Bacteroidales bacterium]|nr:MBOAT family protein [Bacteroidales bacterium]